MDLHALQPGYMLSEYRIERLLGEGGFGLTYLAFDTNLEKLVAIKEYMPSEFSIRQEGSSIVPKSNSNKDLYEWGLKAFINEAKILAKFENPNIVKVYRFIETNGTAYIVMEQCEGGCLNDFIGKDNLLNENQVKKILLPVIKAMHEIHTQGVLHRDIKPDNIMFRADRTPVLIDFGAAREALNSKSRHLTKIYTPGYAPLEQYSSEGEVGPWSDIYSLAAVAYICLTGKKPDDILNRVTDDPMKKLGEKPKASDFLKSIDKALSVHHQDRPQSMKEWLKLWHKEAVSPFEAATTMQSQETLIATDQNPAELKSPTPLSAVKTEDKIEADISEFSHIHHSIRDEEEPRNRKPLYVLFLTLILIAGVWGFKKYVQQQSVIQKNIMNQKLDEMISSRNEKVEAISLSKNESRVREVQRLLKNHQFWNLKVNGVVGSETSAAIRQFQTENQLEVTGTIDDQLQEQLFKIYTQKDEDAWAEALKVNSYEGYVDYQYNHRKGKYLSQAVEKIDEIMATPRVVKSNSEQSTTGVSSSEPDSAIPPPTNELISKVQRELKRIKYNELQVSGQQTPETTLAIKAYNWEKNQSQSGTPTSALLAQLEAETRWPGVIAGESFQDCTVCPEMMVVPGGQFSMGSLNGENNEQPTHQVYISEFSMSITEVTFEQWDACVQSGGCSHAADDNQWGRGSHPVINVNWHDAQQYIRWLKQKTGKKYRLPSESEWEYAAKATSTTEFPWGDEIGSGNAHCLDCNSGLEIPPGSTLAVKQFAANRFGLHDMIGSVWEWVEDCWHRNYNGAPTDGSAWEDPNCVVYTLRSSSSGNESKDMRVSHRGAADATRRANTVGFRVAMDL